MKWVVDFGEFLKSFQLVTSLRDLFDLPGCTRHLRAGLSNAAPFDFAQGRLFGAGASVTAILFRSSALGLKLVAGAGLRGGEARS